MGRDGASELIPGSLRRPPSERGWAPRLQAFAAALLCAWIAVGAGASVVHATTEQSGAVQAPAAGAPAAPQATTGSGIPPQIPASVFARDPDYWDPDLSPRGDRVVARTTIDGHERLVIHDLRDGKASLLPLPPDDGSVEWFEWAGHQRILVSVGWSRTAADETDTYVTRLIVYDLVSGSTLMLGDDSSAEQGDDVLYVDPDGAWLLLSLQPTVDEFPAVFRYDLATGTRTEVVAPQEDVWEWYADETGVVRAGIGYTRRAWFMVYRSDGQQPFRKTVHRGAAESVATYTLPGIASGTDQGYILTDRVSGRYALHEYDYAKQRLGKVVYAHPTNDVEDYSLAADGRSVRSVSYTDDEEHVTWLDPRMRAEQEWLEARFRGSSVLFVARDAQRERYIVWVGSASDPGSYHFFEPGTHTVHELARINSQLDPAQLAPTLYERYSARDGLQIPAFVTLPRGREPRGLPLVVLPHGGPYDTRDLLEYDPEVQFLANRGYVVLRPNFRGSSGYGTEFAARGEGQWGRQMQDDLDDGVDWLVQRGIVDPHRVCIEGSSYGGYAALWAVTRNPDKYRCAASFAGVTDVARQLRYVSRQLSGDDRSGWQSTVRGKRGFDLDSISPLEQVARLTRPVLVAHGEADKQVPYKQATLYRDALERADKPHVFVSYPGESHGFEDPRHFADWLERLGAFLQQHNPAQ